VEVKVLAIKLITHTLVAEEVVVALEVTPLIQIQGEQVQQIKDTPGVMVAQYHGLLLTQGVVEEEQALLVKPHLTSLLLVQGG